MDDPNAYARLELAALAEKMGRVEETLRLAEEILQTKPGQGAEKIRLRAMGLKGKRSARLIAGLRAFVPITQQRLKVGLAIPPGLAVFQQVKIE